MLLQKMTYLTKASEVASTLGLVQLVISMTMLSKTILCRKFRASCHPWDINAMSFSQYLHRSVSPAYIQFAVFPGKFSSAACAAPWCLHGKKEARIMLMRMSADSLELYKHKEKTQLSRKERPRKMTTELKPSLTRLTWLRIIQSFTRTCDVSYESICVWRSSQTRRARLISTCQ